MPSSPRRTRAEWFEAFDAEPDVFWAPVNSVDDLLEDQQFSSSGALVEVPDEQGAGDHVGHAGRFWGRDTITTVACPEHGNIPSRYCPNCKGYPGVARPRGDGAET